MKIFILGTRGFPGVQGGVEKHCEELYPRLVKLGCEIVVCTRRSYIRHYKEIKQWQGVGYKHTWAPKNKNLEAIVHTFWGIVIARINSIRILHIHAVGPAILTPFAKLLGIKVIFTHHGADYKRKKWGKIAKIVLRSGEAMGIRFADKVIVISKITGQFIEKKYRKNDLEFIPNGVNPPEIIPPGDTLEKYKLKPGRYVFTACRFVPEKGLHDLIAAYHKIRNPEFKLVIAGDADHETEYSRVLKKSAEENQNIALTGLLFGKPILELYSNAGLFILPSYYEGLPITLLEALSYGLAVLVSDIPPNREIPLPDFRYFRVGDIDDLYRKMQELIKTGIREEEKKHYRELLEKEYNWDKIAQRTLGVYKSVFADIAVV